MRWMNELFYLFRLCMLIVWDFFFIFSNELFKVRIMINVVCILSDNLKLDDVVNSIEKIVFIIFLVVRYIKGKNNVYIDLKDIDYELYIFVFVCVFICLYKFFLLSKRWLYCI